MNEILIYALQNTALFVFFGPTIAALIVAYKCEQKGEG